MPRQTALRVETTAETNSRDKQHGVLFYTDETMRNTFLANLLILISSTIGLADLPIAAVRSVDFVQDVQPIFQTACCKCHGPLRQEGGYRLDIREIALNGGASYAPNIVPFDSDASPLFQFVLGKVDGMHMPAKGNRLSDEQIAILRAWIDQGASWPDSANKKLEEPLAWWSLQPLRPYPPPNREDSQHPIDAFVRDKLGKRGLQPSPPAEPRVLIRRLYYDLIGLPPSPTEIDEFVSSRDPAAYEILVDRLLASPRYGERWARHWMDIAHFAETHGHDQDRIREHAWPYRDYLIAAFNQDIPYSQFVREQVAADVLAPNDPRAVAGLGFLAAGPWDESSLRDIREDTLDREIARYLDRDDMLTNVMNNFTSLTVQCARCHDHKFDPIPQADYYALQAVFAGVERANRSYDADLSVQQTRQTLTQRRQRLASLDSELKTELLDERMQLAVNLWEKNLANRAIAWNVLTSQTASSMEGSILVPQPDGSFLSSGDRPDRDTYVIRGGATLSEITGLRLEVLTDSALPKQGPGRQDNGNLHLSEIEVEDGKGNLVAIARASSDFDQTDWGIARAIDGNATTAWGIFPQVGKSHVAVFEFKEAVKLSAETTITVRLKQLYGGGHLIGRPRLSVTSDKTPLSISSLPTEIEAILSVEAKLRTDENRLALALHCERERVNGELASLPKPSLVYAAAADFEPDGNLKPPGGPRPIHRLDRGDIRQPKEELTAGSLTCIKLLPGRFALAEPTRESERRAALAEWIVHKDNPLTWRSIVNRVWLQHFGRGIVDTPNDFGRLGSKPSHPELLDWLSIRFRDSGQSLKALHRLIVTSDTYRQKSSKTESLHFDGLAAKTLRRQDAASDVDTDNQLLWHMHRMRLDAECVRDAMLMISGQIDLRMGGPSDRQFDLKPGRHVTPIIDYAQFNLDGQSASRRSIYRFLFRTLPDPFMEALDCPAGDQMMPTRTNSVTVQQVLAMWNDSLVLRQSEQLAKRLSSEKSSTPEQVELAFQLTLGRVPQPSELDRFIAYIEKHGLANFCRLLYNMNEFIFID